MAKRMGAGEFASDFTFSDRPFESWSKAARGKKFYSDLSVEAQSIFLDFVLWANVGRFLSKATLNFSAGGKKPLSVSRRGCFNICFHSPGGNGTYLTICQIDLRR